MIANIETSKSMMKLYSSHA